MPKDSYRQELFAGRADYLERIMNWAMEDDPGECRIFSVAGPPGCGKSWVLGRAEELLEEKGHLVFRLDLSLDPATGASKNDVTVDAELRSWLQKMVDLARQKCGNDVRPYSDLDFLDANLRALAEDVCEKCRPDRPPILMLDGLEEIPDPKQKVVQSRVLGQFWRHNCFRFLLAKRDQDALVQELRDAECPHRLDPLSNQPPRDERREQLRKRIETLHEALRPQADDLIQLLLDGLDPYPWRHPYLNAQLLDLAVDRYRAGRNPPFTRTDLKSCLIEIVKPARFTEAHFEFLRKMAEFCDGHDNEFSAADLRALGYGEDFSHEEFLVLTSQGMVIPAGGARHGAYRLDDDVLGFMRAWLRLPL